jgi:predicted dehydrogenase
MSPVKRVAILGGSIFSAVGRAHISALSMINDVQIAGGCFSRDIEKNRDSALFYGISKDNTYVNFEELIQRRNEYDIVSVLTPTDQHHNQIEKLLLAGVNVISEKSLDTSSTGAKKLGETATQNGVFLAVIFNYTGYPMLREIKNMITRGLLGDLISIQAEMPQEGFLRKDLKGAPILPQAWRLKDAEIPTISLDLGVHLHSIISFCTGLKPKEVVSIQANNGNFAEITDEVVAIIRYQNSVNANFWYSKTSIGNRNGLAIKIFGKNAAIEWKQTNPEIVKFSRNSGEIIHLDHSNPMCQEANKSRYMRFKAGHPAGFIEALANHYEDIFFELAQSQQQNGRFDGEYTFDALDAAEGLELMEAIAKSNRTKEWIEIV